MSEAAGVPVYLWEGQQTVVRGSGLGVRGSGFGVRGAGFGVVWGLGFRVEGLGSACITSFLLKERFVISSKTPLTSPLESQSSHTLTNPKRRIEPLNPSARNPPEP